MKLKNLGYAAFVAATAAALMIGSGGPSEAKAKKKEATSSPPSCWMTQGAVCGSRGGMTFTYASACYAERDGAKVVSNKACATKKAKMSMKKMAKPMKKKDDKKKM